MNFEMVMYIIGGIMYLLMGTYTYNRYIQLGGQQSWMRWLCLPIILFWPIAMIILGVIVARGLRQF